MTVPVEPTNLKAGSPGLPNAGNRIGAFLNLFRKTNGTRYGPADFEPAGTVAGLEATLGTQAFVSSQAAQADAQARADAALATAKAYADALVAGLGGPTVTVPGAPTIGTATPSAGQVSQAFTAPGSNGGATITAYTVTAVSSDGGTGGTTTGPSSPIVVGGLTAGKHYTCTVTATNSAGTGAASAASASVLVPAAGTVNKARPFASASAFNTPLRGGPLDSGSSPPTWTDSTPIHQRLQILGPETIGDRNNIAIDWGNAGSPTTWKFVLTYVEGGPTFNRSHPALTNLSELGPADLSQQSDADHMLILAREDTGRYIEVWRAIADPHYGVVSHMPTETGPVAGKMTSVAANQIGGSGFTTTHIGQWVLTCGGRMAKITGVPSGTVAAFSAGWIKTDGTAATTPALTDGYHVTDHAGIATTIGATSLADSTKNWPAHQFVFDSANYYTKPQRVAICGGVYAVVDDNTATGLTMSGGWRTPGTGAAAATPANGLPFYITGTPSWCDGNMITGLGTGGIVAQGGNTAGGRAANFSWAAGLITGTDLTAGVIDHALALMGGSDLCSTWGVAAPATAPLGALGAGPMGMGYRIAIPNNSTSDTVRTQLTTAVGIMVFDALRNYGAFVGDYAGGGFMYLCADGKSAAVYWDAPLALPWEHGGGDDWAKIAPLLRYTTDYP